LTNGGGDINIANASDGVSTSISNNNNNNEEKTISRIRSNGSKQIYLDCSQYD